MSRLQDATLTPTALLAVDVVVFTLRPGVVVEAEETFDGAARRALSVKAGLDARDWYLEQLATFGSPTRDTRARVASVAHIALVRSDDLNFRPFVGGAS